MRWRWSTNRSRRRRVGLVSGATADVSQPLLSPTYYVQRALAPFADVREPRMGPVEAIRSLLDEKTPMLVLADIGTLPPDLRDRLGAVCAGRRRAAALCRIPAGRRDVRRPVAGAPAPGRPRARRRAVLGQPAHARALRSRASPFYGLTLPRDVGISRQILAEPDADLSRKTWAALADGTPIITAERRGQGLVVLVHVTADTTWSNLPLSGLFVDMLRRIVALAGTGDAQAKAAGGGATVFASPLRTLDGFGTFNSPPATARPVAVGGDLRRLARPSAGLLRLAGRADRGQHAGRPTPSSSPLDFAALGVAPRADRARSAARPAALAGGAGAVRLRARHHRRPLARGPAGLHPQEPPGGGLDRPRRRSAGAGARWRAPRRAGPDRLARGSAACGGAPADQPQGGRRRAGDPLRLCAHAAMPPSTRSAARASPGSAASCRPAPRSTPPSRPAWIRRATSSPSIR